MNYLHRLILPIAICGLPAVACAGMKLTHVGGIDTDAAEIVDYDPANNVLLSTKTTGVDIIDFADPAQMRILKTLSLDRVFDADPSAFSAVSSVAADPQGRGFAVATCIPADNAGRRGRIVIFDTTAGHMINMLTVGYHPDNVVFSDDGNYIIVSNEGELSLLSGYEEDEEIIHNPVQAPGSVSYIDVSAYASARALGGLGDADVVTVDFSAKNLASGVIIDGLRRDYDSGERYLDIEPEYSTYANGRIYTSLQENNALGVLDVTSRKWVAVHSLGSIEQRIDASDKDDVMAVDDILHGMPMPDTVGSYVVDGQTYIVTANEGDTHPADDAIDAMRVKDQGEDGLPAIEAGYLSELNALYPDLEKGALDNAGLGRLNVSVLDGLNSEGEITQLTMFGTRSFSIWSADGTLVWDSGSFFEDYIAANDPDAWDDGRSDNKGPEPEALKVFRSHGHAYAAIGMERTHGIFLFDITDPAAPVFQHYMDTAAGDDQGEAPEGFAHVTAHGKEYIVAAFEEAGDVQVYQLQQTLWTPGGGGQDHNSWYGDVYSYQDGDGWIWEASQGYQYLTGTPEDVWVFDPLLGWMWTSEDSLPLYYSAGLGMWLYYYPETSSPRWYYLFDESSLEDAGLAGYPYATDAELAPLSQ